MKKVKGLIIIIVAGFFLELMSVIQFYSMHGMMSEQLEKRAESELTLKAILIKNMLNQTENALEDYIWDLRRRLAHPDSIDGVARLLLSSNPELVNCWIAFSPYYYPQKGRLFEPCAKRKGENIITVQVGGEDHDYTQMEHYLVPQQASQVSVSSPLGANSYHWTDPYLDEILVTTCSKAIRDRRDSLICVFGADLSLKWLNDTLNVRHIFPSSFILLLTDDGQMIMPPLDNGEKSELGKKLTALINDSSVVRKDSKSGRTKVIHFNSDELGGEGCVFYANMRGKPHWQIGVVCYDNEVYAQLYNLRWLFFCVNLLGFGIILFMIWRFALNQQRLKNATMEQDRISRELHIASNIQMAMLPEKVPVDNNIDVAGRLLPAKEVGGDLYEFFVRNEKLFFCIGDVSGKGIPSALIMAMTEAILRVVFLRENNPARIMEDVNIMACRNNNTNMFATLFVGVLDLPTGHLRYCNAGHDLPLLVDGEVRMLDAEANLPVGVFENTKYVMQEEHLSSNATLFLYTDGLTEAINRKREQFGVHRIKEVLQAAGSNISANELLDKMTDTVNHYIDGELQRDDLTLLAIHYKGEDNKKNILDESIVITNDIQQLRKLTTFVGDIMKKVNISQTVMAQLKLALEETVVNVISYAYPAGVKGNITTQVKYDGKKITFVITDEGVAFDPTQAAKVDTSLSAADRPIGGLGILLVRELMDTVNYERNDGKNVLTLKKKLQVY